MVSSMYRRLFGLAAIMAAASQSGGTYFDERPYNPMNAYEPPKVSGFTECKGRKHLSKKKRKQLKNKSK